MKARLLACPGCARHVRVSEKTCPFCSSPVPESFASAPEPRRPTGRLSRAALYAFSATSLTLATVACGSSLSGSSDSGSEPEHKSTADGPGEMDVQAAYGAPADAGEPVDGEPDGAGEPDAITAAYGLPADAGMDVTITPKDAGHDAAHDSGLMAAYGLPPTDAHL